MQFGRSTNLQLCHCHLHTLFKSLTLETLLGAELKAARHLGEILAASCMVLQTSNPTKLTAKENMFTLLFGFLVVRFHSRLLNT